jgi:hypothetical protein
MLFYLFPHLIYNNEKYSSSLSGRVYMQTEALHFSLNNVKVFFHHEPAENRWYFLPYIMQDWMIAFLPRRTLNVDDVRSSILKCWHQKRRCIPSVTTISISTVTYTRPLIEKWTKIIKSLGFNHISSVSMADSFKNLVEGDGRSLKTLFCANVFFAAKNLT